MNNEVRELKEHVRWLEDQLDWVGHIEEQIDKVEDEIGIVHGRLDKIYDLLDSMCSAINNQNDVINNHSDKLKELIAAFNGIVRLINAQSQPAPSPFTKPLNDRPKHPKRFKPKVVKDDQPPDKPGAA